MEKHLSDLLTLPASGLQDITSVQMLVSCELMKNQLPASPIEPNDNIQVAQDSNGQPLIFTIGTDGVFRMLRFANGSSEGYTSLDLLSGLTGYDKAITFDLSEDLAGRISIAFALKRQNSNFTDLFIAENIPGDSDWSAFAASCKKIQGIDSSFTADHIRLGATDINNCALILISGNINSNEYYYQVNGSDLGTVKMELPENVHQPTEIETGFAFGQKGKFFLYNIGGSQTLECTTLADKFEGSIVYDFSPGNASIPAAYRNLVYNCMATATGRETNPMLISSDLYVGTNQGIILFNGCRINNGGFQLVTDQVKDVHQLYITEDANSISLWAMASPSRLYYIYGKKDANGYTWNDAILFNSGITHIAPIRNKTTLTNELYLVDQNENLIHCWQDPASTIWNQRTLNTKKEAFLLDFNSFTTQVTLADQNGKILAGQQLAISSSEWLFVTINGKVYSLDIDTPAIVPTDSRGMINIIQMTDHIAAPIFHFEAPFLNKVVNIYPNGKIEKSLSVITSGDDLKNAKDPNGNPVLTTVPSGDTLDGVAANLSQMTTAAATHKTGQVKDGDLFVSVTDKGVKESGKLNLSHLPDNFMIGMKLSDGIWQPHTESIGLMKNSVFDDILTFAGDAFQWLENAFVDGIKLIEKGVTYLKDGVNFVISKVGDVLHFVLTIADKVLTIVLDTMVTVFKAINWVLQLIGIDLQAILRWLGHLLGLDDIWETHKVIAALMTNAVSYGTVLVENGLDQLEAFLSKTLNDAENLVLNQVLPAGISTQSLSQSNSLDNPLNSSAGNWIFSQIANNGLFNGGSAGSVSHNPFEQFANDVITPTVSALITDLENTFKDFTGLLAGNVDDAFKMIRDLIKMIIDPIKTIILGIIKFLKELTGDLQAALTGSLDIPFLSTMYKYFTALLGEKEDLTIVNAISFIIAIPYTYISKIFIGAAPFADSDYGMKSSGYFNDLFAGQPSPFKLSGNVAAPEASAGLIRSAVTATKETSGASSAAINYSRIGGSIASLSSIPAGILNMISFLDDSEEPGLSTMDKVSLGFSVVTAALTFPIKKEGQNEDSYILRTTSWVLSVIKDIGFKFIPVKKIAAGSESIVDIVILCLSLPANILNSENGWSYSQDILSNAGGSAAAGGMALKETEAGPVVGVIGAGIAYFGAVIGMVNCIQSDDIVHLVNPGG
ncbi:hypothetical protein N6B72_20285 [Chryseobacterium soli]|uniref:hypothetical protein n=1 Tax=Chryseobacterium soli TaxID=445961 RepID=UPI002953BDCA|nr:hypothetical protein [Chryseobacterium soli]MDV7699266.1 hypothetical protein [Chryseobacterium soli]